VKIFKQISAFIKELTSDNPYLGGFDRSALKTFVENFAQIMNEENSEFVMNLISIYFNVVYS